MELEIALGAAGMLAVALAAALGPRLRIPAPLILVVLGVGVSLLPVVPTVTVAPELVLSGILPPLLYSASVSLPATDLRRELGAVSVLSVALVVTSALALGGLFTPLVPGLPYAWGVALGAPISPTDAVAASIVEKSEVSHRITVILEGEGLLDDASALVLLRAAIIGASASVSLWGVAEQLLWAVAVAVAFGAVVGHLSLWLRARMSDPAVNTVISFTVPFAAALPAEALGGSGLLAAAAGLLVGRRGPRVLGPAYRHSDQENWASASLLLEGAVFLLMGLEIAGIVDAAGGGDVTAQALGIAALALLGVLVVRTASVVPLLVWLHLQAGRGQQARDQVQVLRDQVDQGRWDASPGRRAWWRRFATRQWLHRRITMLLADVDHLEGSRLGPREGTVLVWAGVRGAVTVAAAQTLPAVGGGGPAQRSLLVLVAFGVAALSLLVQGGSLFPLICLLKPLTDDPAALAREHGELLELLRDSAAAVPSDPDDSPEEHRAKQLQASRDALLDAGDLGTYASENLRGALAAIDSEQVALDLKGGPVG